MSPIEPRILFFSGGTALKAAASALTRWTRQTAHIVTPFDSGGSSAVLRKAFSMPAVGDMRSRLLALADLSNADVAACVELLGQRLPEAGDPKKLKQCLYALAKGSHPHLAALSSPIRSSIRRHIQYILDAMPKDMPLGGASIGNLVLAGGYLGANRNFDPILDELSFTLHVQGVVRPSATDEAHLCARLRDGSIHFGQHSFTGKRHSTLPAPIESIWLSLEKTTYFPITVQADARSLRLIQEADLICYPVGSFYSSVLANLLPEGMCRAIANAGCPKVFIPNPGPDPELMGHTLADQFQALDAVARKNGYTVRHLVTEVLIDAGAGQYPGGDPLVHIESQDMRVWNERFVRCKDRTLDPARFSEVLMRNVSMACAKTGTQHYMACS